MNSSSTMPPPTTNLLDEEEEFLGQLCLLTAVLIMGLNEDHAWSVENWCPCQQYLGHKNLLPNPLLGTPWMHFYRNHEDQAIITMMGINTLTFNMILKAGFVSGIWVIFNFSSTYVLLTFLHIKQCCYPAFPCIPHIPSHDISR